MRSIHPRSENDILKEVLLPSLKFYFKVNLHVFSQFKGIFFYALFHLILTP